MIAGPRPEPTQAAALLRGAFDAAVRAVSAPACLPRHLPPRVFPGRTALIAVGKAAGAMAEVAAERLDLAEALVVFPDGHGPMVPLPDNFACIAASHPVPDARGLVAAERALALASRVGRRDRLLVLLSGGGSALPVAPVHGVDLEEKRALTRSLLASGARIGEINRVRQCLSRIKGGRLAASVTSGAPVITLALSDRPGDDLSLVASGPTLPSRATLAEARSVLSRDGIDPSPGIARALRDPSNEPPPFASGPAVPIARPADALRAAATHLAAAGYRPVMLGDAIEGDARALAGEDAARAIAFAASGGRVALIAGGEATVRLPPNAPPGGRNAEYALALAVALDARPSIHALACDSDGIDGTTPAAGAVVAPDTLRRMRAAGIAPARALKRHEAARAFTLIGDAVVTGPTRTNVNDVRLLIVD